MQQGLPGGAIAQGSVFSIFGANLGPQQGTSATSFPLSNTLSGVSITVSQGNTTVNAIPVYVSSSQINAIMPSNAPVGLDSLRVITNGSKGNPVPVQVTATAFGIFSANSAGTGPGILQNFIAAGNQPINSPTIPAQPGQTITLWGTGLGPVSGGDNVPPKVGNLGVKTEVFVGGQPAMVAYSGRASCCAGTDQINFVVPANAPQGCWVPVYVRTNGTRVSNVVTLAIQNDGNTCSDPLNPFSGPVVSARKFGAVALAKVSTHEDVGTTTPVDVGTSLAASAFYSVSAAPFPFHPAASLPPPGTCTEYYGQADLVNGTPPLFSPPPAGTLLNDGSPPTISGPFGSLTLSSILPGFSLGVIGSDALSSGSYTMTGGGGSGVGPFKSTLTVPQPITWTNRDQLVLVDRTQPLTISWSGAGSNDMVALLGIGEDLPTNSGAVFLCMAQSGSSSFTVPADILANLPATEQYVLNSTDVIYLVSVSQTALATVNASGVDSGTAMFVYLNGKTVVYR